MGLCEGSPENVQARVCCACSVRLTWMLFFSGRFVICVRVFINYRHVPVMHGKFTLHALCEIDMGVILLC